MRVLVQRCINASVTVDNEVVGKIDNGLLLLVGFTSVLDKNVIDYMVDKIINLRIFDDDNGVMNKSLLDVHGSILSVSQFTLYADTSRGRRPSYVNALSGDKAIVLYNDFNAKLREKNINVQMGVFGASMKVQLVNDGPVTIMLEK